MTRYEELQELVASYGQATIRLIEESKRLGYEILDGLPAYLECPQSNVCGVPTEENFTPGKQYRDACFSFHHKKVNFLDPVTMGLYVEIGYTGKRGGTWVAFGIDFWISGNDMLVTIAGRKPLTVPIDGSRDLTPIYDETYAEVRSGFSEELDQSNEKSKIGFINAI